MKIGSLLVFLPLIILEVNLTRFPALGQERMIDFPEHRRYEELSNQRRHLSGGGRVEKIRWEPESGSLDYTIANQRYRLDLATRKVMETSDREERNEVRNGRGARPGGVGRAKQREIEKSPDGKWQAVYRDYNVWLESLGSDRSKIQITLEGEERRRFGTCCWVYGEELNQKEAMWWSPDSSKLAYYEIDEHGMRDYYLTQGNTDPYTTIQAVRYPKAGDPNPKVALWIHDLASQEGRRIRVDGEPTQYLFNVRFTQDGRELLINRTNRRQDILDVLAIDVKTLEVRTLVSERQLTWQENLPFLQFLQDQERFVWETESNGWKHYQLRHRDGRLLNPLSQVGDYPCGSVQKVDEEAGWFYYVAYSDSNPYNAQLHRVRFDGSEHRRLTSSPLNHTSFDISPDHKYFVCVREQFDSPPCTVVYDDRGEEVFVLARGENTKAKELGLPPPELFSFLADDGRTILYGTLHKPSHFDPSRKYPLLIDIYGGPASTGLTNRYSAANPICELGFIVAKIGNRGTTGRGKAFESATYLKLGGPDLADQAEGVRQLSKRAYIDSDRVGIFGHSYGGYLSALALLKYPELFHVAVAGAPVTDFRNYDTIYTERYMRMPSENPEGYDQGSCVPLANQLKGKLLLVHGLIDDNVHPSNTWQLSKALHDADRRFEMMIYPEFQHGIGSTYGTLRWEFLYRHLRR